MTLLRKLFTNPVVLGNVGTVDISTFKQVGADLREVDKTSISKNLGKLDVADFSNDVEVIIEDTKKTGEVGVVELQITLNNEIGNATNGIGKNDETTGNIKLNIIVQRIFLNSPTTSEISMKTL